MKRRILLVDDELAILLTLRAILEINGFEAETAASAREAKQKIKNGHFHMVITDMRMESETAGLEVVQAARKAAYKPAVAMLTAFPIDDAGDESAAEVLVKPMNTNDLLIQIEAMLVSHQDKQAAASAPPKAPATAKKSGTKKPGMKKSTKTAAAKSKPRTAAKRSLAKAR